MENRKIRFTKTTIDCLTANSKDVYYFDTEVSGLALRVLTSGYKTYYFYKRIKGKYYRIKIGSTEDISLDKARALVSNYKENIISDKKIHKGIADDHNLTLLDMYHFFMNQKRTELAESTYKEYQKIWREHCLKLANKPAYEITTEDMKELHYHLTVEKGIPYSANRIIVLLKSIFNFAIRNGIFEQFNPCLAVKLNKETPRIRALSEEETKKFLNVVYNYPDIKSRSVVLLLLFTSVRKSNVLGMRWQDIDLKTGTWIIPKTKTDENVHIALVPQAVEVLKEMQHISTNQFVFSSYSKTGHLTHIEGSWKSILQQAGLKNFRIHDIRHTIASRLVSDGVPTFAVKKILTHKTIQSTQVYVNLGVEDVRPDLERTINKLTERK